MKMTMKVSGLLTCAGLVGALATTASAADRGFQFNNLNISPYVNLQYRYDSNVDSTHRGEFDDSILTVTPGVDLKYKGNNWGLDGSAFYGYDMYMKYDELDTHRWGERLKLWYDGERWKLVWARASSTPRKATRSLTVAVATGVSVTRSSSRAHSATI